MQGEEGQDWLKAPPAEPAHPPLVPSIPREQQRRQSFPPNPSQGSRGDDKGESPPRPLSSCRREGDEEEGRTQGRGSELEVVGDAGDEGAEGQGSARHAPEENSPQARPGQLADLHFEVGQGLGPARTPVQAGQQERLWLAAAAAGGRGGLAQSCHQGLGWARAGQLHTPGESEQPGGGFRLIPR